MLVSILLLLIILLGWGLYRDLIIEYYDDFIRGNLDEYGKELLSAWRKFVKAMAIFVGTLLYFPTIWLSLIPTVVVQDLINRYRK
ncbi:hypothetical protein ABSZ6_31 [Acinetobacter phage AB_SZ6]|uniref:Uncharacterized protein n=1 Tax=Acinetobacter phage AB_SZ6 TaxID=2945715 RepID=A0A9E7LT64_9CAUD|nr:hypothetical protein ABSZ6_31 [Acinetobacter phage AB_SZ6]